MKPFFFLLVLGLSACTSLNESFLIQDPQSMLIQITLRYPDGESKTLEVLNYSRLETIWEELACSVCDLRALSPNQLLKDGDVIVLRSLASLTVSINQATVQDLMFLPGIGEVLAQRIVDYRQKYGFFQRIEEIMLVRGIKDGLFAKIKPYLVL